MRSVTGKYDKPVPKVNLKGQFPISCVDLFCGIGGLTHGFIRRGIKVSHGLDVDVSCKYPYEQNNSAKFLERDISELSSDELGSLFCDKPIRLLAGCAPCQPFSTYSRKNRKRRADDKWTLVSHFGRLVDEVQPEIVSMENVPQLRDHAVYGEFMDMLGDYSVWEGIVDCALYGVPQNRKRLVLLASRVGEISLLNWDDFRAEHPTVRSAIEHLPPIEAGEPCPTDRLHISPRLSRLNLRRIRASKPGGTWRDWNKDLLATCHRRESGKTFPAVYGRMEWDQPSPTITTQSFGYGNGRFGHPEQDRAISLREAAILQSFPDHYEFVAPDEPIRFNRVGRLIGNAVPVKLGEVVAESILQHLGGKT